MDYLLFHENAPDYVERRGAYRAEHLKLAWEYEAKGLLILAGALANPAAQQCGWLKDRFGVSWQVVPSILPALMTSPEPGRANRVMQAILTMKKLDIATLAQA